MTVSAKAAGSMKSTGRSGGSVTVNRGYGSTKAIYSSRAKEKEEEEKEKKNSGSAAGSMKDPNRSQRDVYVNRNSGSIKSLYSENPYDREEQANADNSINIADFFKDDKALVASPKSIYNSTWADRPKETLEYTFEDLWPRKPAEERVDVGQLAFGVVDQAADQLIGNAVGAVDMLIGTPYQKALDYAEQRFGLPDMGVNGISALNKRLQESAARDAEIYARNASKSELARLINEYGPDVLAMIPEIALAFASGGTSAAASAGMKGLKVASKADDIADAMKIAGRWAKNNPNTVMNFLQTTGAAHEQALSEGASDAEAYAYALLNGGMDAMITKYGVGAARKGIESLPGNLRDVWKKVSNTVKSADAMVQEVTEGQIRDAMQRASRGIYDENAKLFSLSDKNAVFNPGAMIESAIMDTISPFVMGEIDATRTKGTPEPERVKVDADVENNSHSSKRKKEKNEDKGDNTKLDEQNLEQNSSVQKVLGGEVLNSKEIQNLDMKNPVIQKLVSEKSGIPISPSDNANEALLRKKFQFAAMAIAKRNAQEKEFYSRRSIEKPEVGTYNKTKGRK